MRYFAAALLLSSIPACAFAQTSDAQGQDRPEVVSRVYGCRAIPDAEARLACFDREVAALETAENAKDLVVYDREQVRRTRRSLFGIALPDLRIFGGGDGESEEEEFTQIATTIRSASQEGSGRYVFTLEDGARWAQIDNREFSARPRSGQAIRIRRAAMGSYLANVGTQTAVRVRRVLP